METPMVTVPLERLRALEALEASLPDVIAKAKAERDRERDTVRLNELSVKHKENPKAHSEHVLKKYHTNKEEINARRREAYKLKKEAKLTLCD